MRVFCLGSLPGLERRLKGFGHTADQFVCQAVPPGHAAAARLARLRGVPMVVATIGIVLRSAVQTHRGGRHWLVWKEAGRCVVGAAGSRTSVPRTTSSSSAVTSCVLWPWLAGAARRSGGHRLGELFRTSAIAVLADRRAPAHADQGADSVSRPEDESGFRSDRERDSAGSGQLGDEPGGINGADLGDEVGSGPGLVALNCDDLAALREADRVAALGNVDDAGCSLLLQTVERWVDEPEPGVRVLVGERDDPGELRCRCAGAGGREPLSAGPENDSKAMTAPLSESLMDTSGTPQWFPVTPGLTWGSSLLQA